MAKKAKSRVVLVGTYKKGQLDAWQGLYNWPLGPKDTISEKDAAQIGELWLFNGTKDQRNFKAKFIGTKTRAELVRDYGYPAKGKAHGEKYLLFKTEELFAKEPEESEKADRVVIRLKDFDSSPSVQRQLKAWLESPERKNPALAKHLPKIVTKLKPEQLRVCEAALQMDLFAISRQKSNAKFTGTKQIIDLFAGCGGMSLGFEMAGYHSALAIEKDVWAAETYAYNRKNANVITADITKIQNPQKDFPKIGKVFGIIGGPPCQGFSLSGDRDPKDPRNSLFMDYMRFVREYKPPFFVMENVPGILSSVTRTGEKVKNVITSVAKEIGYNVHIALLNAADYGVPQSRIRVFFFGIRTDYPFLPPLLVPVKTTADSPVTIRDAISDLPVINAGEGLPSMPYSRKAENGYQIWCRCGAQFIQNHIAMKHTKRLIDRFHVIKWGESAADVPHEHMQRKRGNASVISGKIYAQNNMRPFPDKPSPTVPASFQSNFVHPFYDRNYTAREGARLQSFPDSYVFCGKRTTMSWEKHLSQYQQIGNAVPPLLAKAIAQMMTDYFAAIASDEEKEKP